MKIREATVAAAVLLLASPLAAQGPPHVEKAAFRAASAQTAWSPGETARIAVVMTIEDGWHTNSHLPTYEYLIPTSIAITPPSGWPPPGEVENPPGRMESFAFADQPLSVYAGEVVFRASLPVPVDAAASQASAVAEITYQACNDRSCLPPVTARSELTLVVGERGEPSGDPAFRGAGAANDSAAGDREAAGGSSGSHPLAAILLLAALGGLILNAMPCVLPILSLKVFGLVKSAGQGRAQVVTGALATALGILLSFWALALAAILVKAAGGAVGWGMQFQEPIFVACLTVVVLLFALNLWGLFEIPLPGAFSRLAEAGPHEGPAGHLMSGLFATLMATPCSAPYLGSALGFALGQHAPVIFATFTAVAFGMALPYLALAVAPGAARLLPKPGPWMSTFKMLMGFLMAAAGVWLFYVLAAQITAERLALFQLGLVAVAASIWVHRSLESRRRARMLATLAVVLSIALSVGLTAGPAARLSGTDELATDLIQWTRFDRQEAESLAAGGRLVFIDVTADWCFTCKVNERLVLETAPVANAFEQYAVVPMKADWTNRSEAIGLFLAEHGRYGIPFYMLYRPGEPPHVFSELLSQEELLVELERAGRQATR